MSIEKDIFKKSKVSENKLIKYGFKKEKDNYIYSKDIMNNCMRIYININKNKELTSKIIDKDFNEEYTAFRSENSNGSFNSKVREEYKEVLGVEKIKEVKDLQSLNICIAVLAFDNLKFIIFK